MMLMRKSINRAQSKTKTKKNEMRKFFLLFWQCFSKNGNDDGLIKVCAFY